MLLVAVAVRLATLGTWSVWLDEAFTLHDARHGAPPYALSYVLTGAIVTVLGDAEWALRVMPCAAGVATVALLLAARPAPGSDARTPLVAALLLAVLPWHLFMSQNARYYALQALGVLAAFLAADGRLRRDGRPRPVLAVASFAVAAGCHPTAVFFAPGLLLVALRHLHGRARVVTAVAGVVLTVAAAAVYVPLQGGYAASKGSGSVLQLATSYGYLAGPALLLVAAVGAAARPRPAAELLLLLPTAAAFVAVSGPLFVTGYHAFASVPVVVLLAAHGLVHAGRARGLLAMALAAGVAHGQWSYHAGHGLRPRYREATAWLAEARADGCRVFATQAPPVAYHLGERGNLRVPTTVTWLQPWSLHELEQAIDRGPVVVLLHPDELHAFDPPARTALDALLARLPEERRFTAAFGPKDLTLQGRRTRR